MMKKKSIWNFTQFAILVICVVGITILVNCVFVPWADVARGNIPFLLFLERFLGVSLLGVMFGAMLGCFLNIFYCLIKDE